MSGVFEVFVLFDVFGIDKTKIFFLGFYFVLTIIIITFVPVVGSCERATIAGVSANTGFGPYLRGKIREAHASSCPLETEKFQ